MVIDVTALFEDSCQLYAASVAEYGNNAAAITWENALTCEHKYIVHEEQREDIVDYFAEYGAWTREELEKYGLTVLNAMVVQEVASAIRARDAICDTWEEYREQCEAGQLTGRMYTSEGKVYYQLEN